jgi:hypothetical protein
VARYALFAGENREMLRVETATRFLTSVVEEEDWWSDRLRPRKGSSGVGAPILPGLDILTSSETTGLAGTMTKPNGLPDSSPGFQGTLGPDPRTRFQPRRRLWTRAP